MRRGAVAALMAILFPVVLILCLFSVNLAYMLLMRTELRVATDSAARAASATYSRTNNEAASITAAKQIALQNQVGGVGLVLNDADVVFGRTSQPSAGARYQFSTGAGTRNAVTINATASSRPLFGGQIFSSRLFSPQQTATASFDNIDICLVLDRSSSMKLYATETGGAMSTSDPRFCQLPAANSRWAALRSAVNAFTQVLQQTPANEHVAVVTYASDYNLPCSPAVTSPKSRIDSHLNGDLTATTGAMTTLSSTNWGGMTDIEAGVITGRGELTNPTYARTNARKVMIVLTDGHYTAADPVPQGALAAAQGIIVHTITFGTGANQSSMQALAAGGGGTFHHAPDQATLESIFRKLAAMSVMLTN
ncbi:MAG: VWA domain-containing protein [Planctomycetaceae bacterium]